MQTHERFYVLTGGPGSGKTTLLEALKRTGFATTPEAGRGIIQDQSAINGPALPWKDPALFAELMLSWEMRNYRQASLETGPVFFDRGMPDLIGYLKLSGLPVPDHFHRAAEKFRYNRKVFILPPWREIFSGDSERKQSFDEAQRTYDAMIDAYSAQDYALTIVEPGTVEQRAGFIRAETGL
ncbi:AAA family ATPase [Mesorhizobium sp. SB112]|uniref:AAA family ATPase n=1 Tax=Mesorhizobium sp. SB112 TaxID=3151853 RepID=UPI003264B9F5